MIQAYNHFLSDYTSRLSANSTAHKQRELKAVYNRILSMTKRSPYYKLDISSHKQVFALDLKDAALSLSSSLKDLKGVLNSSHAVKTADSSAPDFVAASLTSQSAEGFTEPVQIQVRSLAQGQVNTGQYVPSNTEGPSPDSYRFTIQIEEDTYEFSYHVSSSSTNRELMQKLSDFINKSGIGIHAELENHPTEPLSRLVLSSLDTGVAGGDELFFHISDSPNEGSDLPGLVRYFGLDRVSQLPSNAEFTINGEDAASMHNSVTLNQSLSLRFLQVSGEEITITPGIRSEDTLQKVTRFVNSYNSLIRLANNGPAGNRRSQKLKNELNHIVQTNLEMLNECGIKRDENLTLSVDKDALLKAESNQTLKTWLEEPDGLIASMQRRTNDIAINPMDYLDKIVVTYPNFSRNNYSNPYMTSIYSGMMLNAYC
ncbi:MAG: hypothetical protein IJY09_06080 [Lachnospiraceae bacterium]|nr:hypothetical protein [Lachnospiraceae bacterium]